ncbi:MAG: ABC transporter substrate-binding protein [Candidatus Syntrophosphaera sp.]|nr:ABC transporter substrate-binding protein [Candidatus Syntrophosphaera sp.]
MKTAEFERLSRSFSAWMLALALIAVLLAAGCGRTHKEEMRIGVIKPSVDHLPLTHAHQTGQLSPHVKLVNFSSGWEVQEALIAGRIDAAIMPFTYAWNAASLGYPLRIVSHFELETDGIIVPSGLSNFAELNEARIGLLKASTLEILFIDWARERGIIYDPVYFRTPNEMAAALEVGDVDAIVTYEPLIQKLPARFKVLHYFKADYPGHPCCDFVINVSGLTQQRRDEYRELLDAVKLSQDAANRAENELLDLAGRLYGLDRDQTRNALSNTVYMTGLSEAGMAFERKMTGMAIELGYQYQELDDSEIFLRLE